MAQVCYQMATASAEGGTAETAIGTIQLNARARRVLGVFAYSCGAGLTTLEGLSGRVEVKSSDLPEIQPCQIPLSPIIPLTSGTAVQDVKVWPTNCPCKGQEILAAYVKLDLATAIAQLINWGVAIEVA